MNAEHNPEGGRDTLKARKTGLTSQRGLVKLIENDTPVRSEFKLYQEFNIFNNISEWESTTAVK